MSDMVERERARWKLTLNAAQERLDRANIELADMREQRRRLVDAADEFHRVTFAAWSHRPQWQRLGGVLDEVAPREFNRVTGDPSPTWIGETGMIGRRIPIPEDPADAWAAVTEPGDYCGPVGAEQSVYFLLPNARDEGVPPECRSVNRISSPPWDFRECPDGSLEARASIAILRGDGSHAWHGYLDEGHVWRTA